MGTELNSTRTHLNCADTVFRVTRPSYTVLVYFADNGRLYHRGYIKFQHPFSDKLFEFEPTAIRHPYDRHIAR